MTGEVPMATTHSFSSHIIDGREVDCAGGTPIESMDPFNGKSTWTGAAANEQTVARAVAAARRAFPKWRAMSVEQRTAYIKKFTELVQGCAAELAELISRENGKPLWDARTEVNSLLTKLTATVEAYERRAAEATREVRGMLSRTRFLPHGVMAVLGPFNFPMSMPNSHIMPALFAGNTVVYKPSEFTPLCGLMVSKLWQEAGLPPGVLNCVSGGPQTGKALVEHADVDGVLFIGSHRGGLGILRTLVDHPEKIVALEMGGNNPLVIWDYDNIDVAAHIAVQSSMVSAGQRCSAARRLIVRRDDQRLLDRLVDVSSRLRIGHYSATPEPFYGPLIRPAAAKTLTDRFGDLVGGGARPLLKPGISGSVGTLLSPGILDVTECRNDADEELFGPILKVYRVDTFDQAVELADRTKFGLSAGVMTRDRNMFDHFAASVRAGIVNWNQQLTGATTFAPFGGVKQSGNFRPAGYLSVDYCSYAVASFEVPAPKLPETLSPGITL